MSFNSYAKLSSADGIDFLIEKSLPGIKATYLPHNPDGTPRRPDGSYFRIDMRDKGWDSVRRSKNIALFWDEAPEDLVVEFIVSEG